MLSAQPTLLKRLFNLLFLIAVAAAAVVYAFHAELAEGVSDGLAGNDTAIKRKWDPGLGGQFVLRPESNDTAFLQVLNLRAGAATPIGIPVSFDLVNLGDANEFPNIAVVMVDASRRPLRQILYSPKDYAHESRFEKQRIELLLEPRRDERSFTVRVFYGERP